MPSAKTDRKTSGFQCDRISVHNCSSPFFSFVCLLWSKLQVETSVNHWEACGKTAVPKQWVSWWPRTDHPHFSVMSHIYSPLVGGFNEGDVFKMKKNNWTEKI